MSRLSTKRPVSRAHASWGWATYWLFVKLNLISKIIKHTKNTQLYNSWPGQTELGLGRAKLIRWDEDEGCRKGSGYITTAGPGQEGLEVPLCSQEWTSAVTMVQTQGKCHLSLWKWSLPTIWCHHPKPRETRTLCFPYAQAHKAHGPPLPSTTMLRKHTLKSIMMSWSWNLLSRSNCRETGFTSGRTKSRKFRPERFYLLSPEEGSGLY